MKWIRLEKLHCYEPTTLLAASIRVMQIVLPHLVCYLPNQTCYPALAFVALPEARRGVIS